MIERNRSCSVSRTSSWSRSRSRAKSWRSSKSSADSRCFAAAYSAANRSRSSCKQLAVARRELLERRLLQPVARRAKLGRAVAARRQVEIEQLLGVRAERERAGRRGELRSPVASGSAARAWQLRAAPPAARRRRRALRARARDRGRPSAASRRRRSASCASPARRTSRAAATARGRARRRTRRARVSNASPRSTAAWSSASSWKRGSRPTGNGCARSRREQKPWIVEIHAPSSRRARSCRPRAWSAARIRARSSPAALRVYVITSSDSTSSPCSQTAAHEPLDEHGRLAGAGAGRDEHLARRVDGGALLGVHDRSIRHIVQRSHHAGHASPFGSCRTSPAWMRSA